VIATAYHSYASLFRAKEKYPAASFSLLGKNPPAVRALSAFVRKDAVSPLDSSPVNAGILTLKSFPPNGTAAAAGTACGGAA